MEIPGEIKCVRCGGEVDHLGRLPLVTGSHSGAAKFWLGQLAEVDERPWFVDVHRCQTCRHVELFDLNDYKGS